MNRATQALAWLVLALTAAAIYTLGAHIAALWPNP